MSKVINFAERRAEKESKKLIAPMPGYIFWLHCPVCRTTEYTEVQVNGGRIHNKCGAIVEENAVPIDIRAEYTIIVRNLEVLDGWSKKKNIPNFKNL